MKRDEFDTLLRLIDRMIELSEPRTAEYYRGYHRGIRYYFLGVLEEPVEDPSRLRESYADSGDHYLDAYARGYLDGCKGMTPDP